MNLKRYLSFVSPVLVHFFFSFFVNFHLSFLPATLLFFSTTLHNNINTLMVKGGDVGHSMEYDKQAASLKRKEDKSNGETPAKMGRETSSPSLDNRARADSFDSNSDDGFMIPLSQQKANNNKANRNQGSTRPRSLDHLELVLIVDRPSINFTNRCKSMIGKEVQRLAEGVVLTGIFFMPRGGIKLICGSPEMKECIMKSKHWGVDAFGSKEAACHPPRAAGCEPSKNSNVKYSEEYRSFIDLCKVVVAIPAEYTDSTILEKFRPLGVNEIKTLPASKTISRPRDPLRMLIFKDVESASWAISSKFAFNMDGCAYRGRYMRVAKPPIQCKRCLKFGHPTTVCTENFIICSSCGEQGHSKGDPACTSMETTDAKCVNCGGNHDASSTSCPSFIEAKEKLKASALKSATRKDTARKAPSYAQVASRQDNNTVSRNKNTPEVADNKVEKLLVAFISILISSRNEKDNAKLVTKAIAVIEGIVPELLDSSLVRSSLGLDLAAADQHNTSSKVGNTAPKC